MKNEWELPSSKSPWKSEVQENTWGIFSNMRLSNLPSFEFSSSFLRIADCCRIPCCFSPYSRTAIEISDHESLFRGEILHHWLKRFRNFIAANKVMLQRVCHFAMQLGLLRVFCLSSTCVHIQCLQTYGVERPVFLQKLSGKVSEPGNARQCPNLKLLIKT